jgi:hypothetical protein
MGEGIAGDGDVFHFVAVRSIETDGRGKIGESGPMLDAVQALLFDCRLEFAVVEESGGSVAMEGV